MKVKNVPKNEENSSRLQYLLGQADFRKPEPSV